MTTFEKLVLRLLYRTYLKACRASGTFSEADEELLNEVDKELKRGQA